MKIDRLTKKRINKSTIDELDLNNSYANLTNFIEQIDDISDYHKSVVVKIDSAEEIGRFFQLIYGRITKSKKVDEKKLIVLEDDKKFIETQELYYVLIYDDIETIKRYLDGNDFDHITLKKYLQ